MNINKEQEEIIINMAIFGYDVSKMASILSINENDLIKEIQNPGSEFSKLLKKGSDLADYVIDLKLFELAKTGDIKALNKLDSRKGSR